MVTVKLYRSGMRSKDWYRVNHHQNGAFVLKFPDMESLVSYVHKANDVYLIAESLTPEQRRVYYPKIRALYHKRDKQLRSRNQ